MLRRRQALQGPGPLLLDTTLKRRTVHDHAAESALVQHFCETKVLRGCRGECAYKRG